MNYKQIQAEVNKVDQSTFAKKTDKQLLSYDMMSTMYKQKYQGLQPISLAMHNNRKFRRCKLNEAQVAEIRGKYNPHVYGKAKLAKEYGVSAHLILKIIRGKIWN